MLSYHNDHNVKNKVVNRMQAHVSADELVRGVGWETEGGKRGCAVGCTLDKYEHAAYETELGLPVWLAHLEDWLFENVGLAYSKDFPLRFLKAIPVGLSTIDFDKIKANFLSFILEENIERVEKLDIKDSLKAEVMKAINQCLSVQQEAALSGEIDKSAARSAESAARSAAERAESAAQSAACSAGGGEADFEQLAEKLIELLVTAKVRQSHV